MSPRSSTRSDPLFGTPRLRCRRWVASDLDALATVYGDADAMRFVGDGEPLAREGCERWLEVTAENYRKRGYGMFALEEKVTGQVVGFCGIVHPGGQPSAEVKYALVRSQWGRGFATEALRALLAYGRTTHGLERIIATVAPANRASARVVCKAGMRKVETRANEDGTSTDVYEWDASTSR